ncbi:MAG: 5-formyltetrahydrofolate cyclo-ligase [Sporolactobacillus sp.]
MSEKKRSLRTIVRKRLAGLDESFFQSACQSIAGRLTTDPLWRRAKIVAITLSVGREVDTSAIIRFGKEQGKCMVVPRCRTKEHELDFYRLDDKQLAYNKFGLLEPIPEHCIQVGIEALDLVIVPGVVFDRRGFRIGYGGGYYDRLLSKYGGPTIALLLSAQLSLAFLPSEAHDVPVDRLITEKEIIDIGDNA